MTQTVKNDATTGPATEEADASIPTTTSNSTTSPQPPPHSTASPSTTTTTTNSSAAPNNATSDPAQTLPLTPPDPLTTRYSRQLLLPQLGGLRGQRRLADARVLLVGLGGLGCPAALYLAGAGVGTLGFVDGDVVEESNLHRQVLHSEGRVGMLKVESARVGVGEVNSGVKVRCYPWRVDGRGILGVLEEEWEGREGWDVVLDCSDNPATRYAVSDAAVLVECPVVSGAAQRGEGMLMVLGWRWGVEGRGPCYRCVFPRPPDPDMVKGCSEIGVLGTAVGCVGVLMAQEAVKLVVNEGRIVEGAGSEGKGEMLLFNAFAGLKGMWRGVGLRRRREACVGCGNDESVRSAGGKKITREEVKEGRLDYELFCGRVEDVKVLREEERIGARPFLDEVSRGKGLVVDVREEIEVELGSQIPGAVVVPFSKILKDAEGAFSGVEWEDNAGAGAADESDKVYFVCQRGNDSQIAARRLMDVDAKLGRKRGWVGDVKGGFVAMERLQNGAL